MQYKALELINHLGVTRAWQLWPDLSRPKHLFRKVIPLWLLYQYLLPDKNILWKKELPRVIPQETKWVKCGLPSSFHGFIMYKIHVLWSSCSEMHTRSFWDKDEQHHGYLQLVSAWKISAYHSLSETVRILGKKDLKWLRLKKNSLWSLRKWNKVACYPKSCLS